MKNRLGKSLLMCSLIGLALPSLAKLPQTYDIDYVVKRDGSEYGKASRTLIKTSDTMFELSSTFKASILFYDIEREEVSRFSASDDHITPLTYRMTDKRTFKDRKVTESTFDYTAGKIVDKKTGESVPLTPATPVFEPLLGYDVLMAKARDGLKQDTSLTIFDEGKVETYTFKFEGEEEITTPLGNFDAIKFTRTRETSTRRTSIWFSPTHDYLPLKLSQSKDGDVQATLVATKVKVKD